MDASTVHRHVAVDLRSEVPAEAVTRQTVRMVNERYCCVRDATNPEQPRIFIVDVAAKTITRQPCKSPSTLAVMAPVGKTIAMQLNRTIQVFDLERKERVGETELHYDVNHITWVNDVRLGVVTEKHVYHWSLPLDSDAASSVGTEETSHRRGSFKDRGDKKDSTKKAKKMFELAPEIKGGQMLAYSADAGEAWLLLAAVVSKSTADPPPPGGVEGVLQLYSVDKKASRTLDGFAGCFATHPAQGASCLLLCYASRTKLTVMELPTVKKQTASVDKQTVDIDLDDPQDFPLAVIVEDALLHVVTMCGAVLTYYYPTLEFVGRSTVGGRLVLALPTEEASAVGGFMGVANDGNVMRCRVDIASLVEKLKLTNPMLALRVSGKALLPGAELLFSQHFKTLVSQGDVNNAIALAVDSPGGSLRTIDTIRHFQGFPQIPGEVSVLMLYFNKILETAALNAVEGIELAKVVLLKQGGAKYITELVEKKKIEGSEELGDRLRPLDADLALNVYREAGCHNKAIKLLIERQMFRECLSYVKSVKAADAGTLPEWRDIITELIVANAEGASEFALLVHRDLGGDAVDPRVVVQLFVDRGCVKEATGYLLALLDRDDEADEELQTMLFEMNLLHTSPMQVEALFGQGRFTKYNAKKIATLCEKAGLHQRALKLYCKALMKGDEGVDDGIERTAVAAAPTAPKWLPGIVRILPSKNGFGIVRALLIASPRQNAPICTEAVMPQLHKFEVKDVVALFMEAKAYAALFRILSVVVNKEGSTDRDIHTALAECAIRSGNSEEAETITRTSSHYDPNAVLTLLGESRLSDPWPYINVCDKYSMFGELVSYLIATRNLRYLDLYLCEKAPHNTPKAVAALLDAKADDLYITALIAKVHGFAAGELVKAAQARGQLGLITPWMEGVVGVDPATATAAPVGALHAQANHVADAVDEVVYTALALQYIDTSKPAVRGYLRDYSGKYSAGDVGRHAEGVGKVELAFLAYQSGDLDADVLRITDPATQRAHADLDGLLADYLVHRGNLKLWTDALARTPRDSLVNTVVTTTLPKVKDPKHLSVAVKAFTQAGLPDKLTLVLEQLVLNDPGSPFRENRYLQNLLILTVTQTKPDKVMGYIKRMDRYDADEVAGILLKKDLKEEALQVYKQTANGQAKAMSLLINTMKDLLRAKAYATETANKDCWLQLAQAYFSAGDLLEALYALTQAQDTTLVRKACTAVALEAKKEPYVALIKYLHVVHTSAEGCDASLLTYVDTELAYAMARVGQSAELSQFLSTPNLANLTQAGERCFGEGLFGAARVLFTADRNYTRLASTLIQQRQYLEALDAAQKACHIGTWKEVCFACVDAGELRFAQIAAQHIITVPVELDELCRYFERKGCINELADLLRTGVAGDTAHIGLYTELGVLYCQYDAGKVLGYLTASGKKVNKGAVMRACEANHLWDELRLLHTISEDYDAAVTTTLDHPACAWEHASFMTACRGATIVDLLYNAVQLYMTEHPELLEEFLHAVSHRVSADTVVAMLQREDMAAVAKGWMVSVQKVNSLVVNSCINDLYIEEEDYDALRTSLTAHRNFDAQYLAQRLRTHPLIEMRRVSSWLFAQCSHHQTAIDMSVADKLYQDAIDFANASADSETVNRLLSRFLDLGLTECFGAALYTCYAITEPDIAMELAWRHKVPDIVMPYMCQVLKELWDSRCKCNKRDASK